jgi:prevent-host-death family protein
MATTLSLAQAKRRFSVLVDRAARGEEIVITKRGKPLAKLVAVTAAKSPRRPSGALGNVWMADDFDAPLPPDVLKSFGIDP